MKYELYKSSIVDGREVFSITSKMLGQEWIAGQFLKEEIERFTTGDGITAWKLKGFKHKSHHRLDFIFTNGLPMWLEWYWGEPHFWDAGRQGGKASYYPAEMLSLWRPLASPKYKPIMITDLWWSNDGFFYQETDKPHETYIELCRKAVDAYVNNQSPAEAVGYPGPDFPSTMRAGYTRRRGPAKSTIENPQQFLDDRQHKNGVMTPKSIDGSV